MNIQHATTTVSLGLRAPSGITVNAAPSGLRSWVVAGTAVASGLIYLLRKGYSDGVRRRVIRRLDVIAPRVRFHESMISNGTIFNTDCPVCLCEFVKLGDKMIRILECGHALCSGCLEAWAVHCTKAHLNPSRFGITRNGRVFAWTSGPKCPLCCARLNCVPKEDLRKAVLAAIGNRGVALSTFVAFQNPRTSDTNNNNTQEPEENEENEEEEEEEVNATRDHIWDGGGERDGDSENHQDEENHIGHNGGRGSAVVEDVL